MGWYFQFAVGIEYIGGRDREVGIFEGRNGREGGRHMGTFNICCCRIDFMA